MSDFNPTPGHVNVITAENIEAARPHLPPDQAEVLMIGCKTWAVTCEDGQPGQMTRWPDRRGAIHLGGNLSLWGDWSHFGVLHTDGDFSDFDRHGQPV